MGFDELNFTFLIAILRFTYGLRQSQVSMLSLVYSLLELRLISQFFERDTQVVVGSANSQVSTLSLVYSLPRASNLPSSLSVLPKLLWASA